MVSGCGQAIIRHSRLISALDPAQMDRLLDGTIQQDSRETSQVAGGRARGDGRRRTCLAVASAKAEGVSRYVNVFGRLRVRGIL